MPGKSRHRKDKHLLRSKPSPAQTQEPVVHTPVAAASANVSTRTTKPPVTPSLYINREIRSITLLAGLMLVLLIVAAFIAR